MKQSYSNDPSRLTPEASPLLTAAVDGFVAQDLEDGVSHLLAVADLGQGSVAQVSSHYLVLFRFNERKYICKMSCFIGYFKKAFTQLSCQ